MRACVRACVRVCVCVCVQVWCVVCVVCVSCLCLSFVPLVCASRLCFLFVPLCLSVSVCLSVPACINASIDPCISPPPSHQGSVTLNLPSNALFGSVKIALMLALFQSIGIQFFPPIGIIERTTQPMSVPAHTDRDRH